MKPADCCLDTLTWILSDPIYVSVSFTKMEAGAACREDKGNRSSVLLVCPRLVFDVFLWRQASRRVIQCSRNLISYHASSDWGPVAKLLQARENLCIVLFLGEHHDELSKLHLIRLPGTKPSLAPDSMSEPLLVQSKVYCRRKKLV